MYTFFLGNEIEINKAWGGAGDDEREQSDKINHYTP